MFDLTGKTALITGTSRGLGQYTWREPWRVRAQI